MGALNSLVESDEINEGIQAGYPVIGLDLEPITSLITLLLHQLAVFGVKKKQYSIIMYDYSVE
jgi:hypothetical protein